MGNALFQSMLKPESEIEIRKLPATPVQQALPAPPDLMVCSK